METAVLGTVVAASLTIVGLLVAAFRAVSARVEEVARGLHAEIASARKDAERDAEKVCEVESKARHAMANSLQSLLGTQAAKIDRLEGDAVRRAELGALETRLTTHVAKVEDKVDELTRAFGRLDTVEAVLKRLEAGVDRLTAAGPRANH